MQLVQGNHQATQLAMRSLCLDHFSAHESFLHTWEKSPTVAMCGVGQMVCKDRPKVDLVKIGIFF